MTTDRYIPERWKNEHAVCGVGYRTVIEELGTAESLVRELARALQDMCYSCIASDDGPILKEPDYDMLTRSHQVLDDVPAHLRAPETTSTGESSQEDA